MTDNATTDFTSRVMEELTKTAQHFDELRARYENMLSAHVAMQGDVNAFLSHLSQLVAALPGDATPEQIAAFKAEIASMFTKTAEPAEMMESSHGA